MKQKPIKHNAKIRMARRLMTNAEKKEHCPLFGSKGWFVRSMVRHRREIMKTLENA